MEVVIRAMAHVRDALPYGVRLIVQGTASNVGYYRSLEALVRNLRLEDTVLLGRGVDAGALRKLYASCRALVFPAIGENCPITLLEAMTAGTPIIGADCAPIPEICGEGAAYFREGDEQSCAAAILRMFRAPGWPSVLSAAAKERSQRYTWDRSAEMTAQTIQRAARARGRNVT
jgi:glycosyltransferase involved in cell wall biosynthesis